jgi:hypothetical protein
MKKLLITLLLLSGMHSYAQEVKTAFIPHIANVEQPNGTFGQDEKGGFICYGTISRIPQRLWDQVEFTCSGKKVDVPTHVKHILKGDYLGANFAYENPSLYYNKGIYSLRPDITGLIVYYK